MKVSTATALVGGLGKPSKMPGKAYGTSALLCQTGSKLREVKGSVCSKCYARKGQYVFPGVVNAHAVRMASVLRALSDDGAHAEWVSAMATLLRNEQWFRWHDAGDLQSVAHFALIVAVCEATPHVRHWLPTKEPRYVTRWINAGNTLPSNLIVRASAPMVDGPAPQGFANTSTVHNLAAPLAGSHVCPAPTQEGKCGDCRACWTHSVANVSYHQH